MAGISWIASRSLFKTIHRIVLPPAADTPHLAMTGRVASLRACEAIQLVVQDEAGLPRRFAPRNDGVGDPEPFASL